MSKIERLVLRGGLAAFAVASWTPGATAADLQREAAKLADAEYYTSSPDGCAFEFTSVRVRQTTQQSPPGAPTISTRLELMVSRNNMCTYEWYFADGSTEDVAFALDGNLLRASAQGTVQVCGFGGPCTVVSIDIAWEGVGELFRGGYADYGFGPYLGRYRFNGSSREALATGTLVDEAGTSIVSGPSNSASLGRLSERTVTPQ